MGLSAGRRPDGPRLPQFVLRSTNIGMASGTLEVYPISRVVAIGMGTYISFGEGKHSRHVCLHCPGPVGSFLPLGTSV